MPKSFADALPILGVGKLAVVIEHFRSGDTGMSEFRASAPACFIIPRLLFGDLRRRHRTNRKQHTNFSSPAWLRDVIAR